MILSWSKACECFCFPVTEGLLAQKPANISPLRPNQARSPPAAQRELPVFWFLDSEEKQLSKGWFLALAF
jgi:hypothetical protein